ncbi:c-type cytochrome [Flaviaesturariibacter terrae]
MKIFLCAVLASFLIACGSNGPHATESTTAAAGAPAGKALIAKSDCLSCHKETEPMVGPAYNAIARRYAGREDAVPTLAAKIIRGGSGNWGQTPMTPHAGLSPDDADEMARYILSLK